MTEQQLEALRLADALETAEISYTSMVKAAAELRRLHSLNQKLLDALKEISAIENQERGADWEEIEQARSIADAAIAKAEGANND